jgi:hypothetical protein
VGKKEELLAQFQSRGRRSGRLLTLDPHTAIELVTAAEAAGVRVLGVDGFLVSTDGLQPLQQTELDVEDAEGPYEATRAFLNRFVGLGLMFEVSLDDE